MVECINKIELQGRVGMATFRNVGDTQLVDFSLCTEYVNKDREGNVLLETTWFSCRATGSNTNDLLALVKGNIVNITGRVKTVKYIDVEGNEKDCFAVICQSIKLVQ